MEARQSDVITPPRAPERILMIPVPPAGRAKDPGDPVVLRQAVSELEVYRQERLAYTDCPARPPKPQRPVIRRTTAFIVAVYRWVIARR